jgi:FMN phosphatase YigB (HAD superfamily)
MKELMKFIAIDIGNVLVHADMKTFIDNLSDTFNISEVDATRFLRSFQVIHDLGITTMENQLRDRFNCKSDTTIKRLTTCWDDCIYPHITIIDIIHKLMVNHDVKVALLSNIGVEHAIIMEHKLHPIYDDAIKHVGARKPTALYYQSFLMQYPEFTGCLYIDDLHDNLDASKNFGFQTFHLDLDEPGSYDKILEIQRLMTMGQ